ncbi:hypothetical protein GCM10011371_34950 [Novosphingobium marinum]|nr:hypothetical protein GCM10011371_34950 [Novosphingobium marinum]
MLRTQPHARSVIEPQPAALRLLLRNLQHLATPDASDPFGIRYPAVIPQQGRDPAIAVTAILLGPIDDRCVSDLSSGRGVLGFLWVER